MSVSQTVEIPKSLATALCCAASPALAHPGFQATGEGFGGHPGQAFARQADTLGLAQENLAQITENLQAVFEISGMFTDDHCRIGGKRMRIDRSHEDRTRYGIQRRHLAERTGAQGGPQTGLLQVVTHRLGLQTGQLGRLVAGKGDGVIALQVDHHRLQHALLAAVDCADRARARGGEYHARRLLVGEHDLSELDPVTHLDRHRRLHAVVVEPDDGHAAHRPSGLDALLWSAGDGQVQTAFDSNHAPLAR